MIGDTDQQIKMAEEIEANTEDIRRQLELAVFWIFSQDSSDFFEMGDLSNFHKILRIVQSDIDSWKYQNSASMWIRYQNELEDFGCSVSRISVPGIKDLINGIFDSWLDPLADVSEFDYFNY